MLKRNYLYIKDVLMFGKRFQSFEKIKHREKLNPRVDNASFIEFGKLKHPKLILCYVNFVPRAKL